MEIEFHNRQFRCVKNVSSARAIGNYRDNLSAETTRRTSPRSTRDSRHRLPVRVARAGAKLRRTGWASDVGEREGRNENGGKGVCAREVLVGPWQQD